MNRYLDVVAGTGIPLGVPWIVPLAGKKNHGLFEFKDHALARVFWFRWVTDPSIIICTHGYNKDAYETPHQELENARNVRDRYNPKVKS